MAIPLPGGPDPDPVRQQKFERLARAVPGTGGRDLEERIGTFQLSFVAGNTATTGSIPHGLGRVPLHVSLTAMNVPGYTQIPAMDWHSATASTFDVSAVAPGSSTVTLDVSFHAIG